MVEITEDFSVRFNEALEQKNIKPADLSRQTGISEATISQYRSGYSKPKDKRLVAIANVLDVDAAWLMGIDTREKRYGELFSYLDHLSDKDIDMITYVARRLCGEARNGDEDQHDNRRT